MHNQKIVILDLIQPMGSLYEQYSLLLFDTLILRMLKKGYINAHKLREMHSNLE